MERKGKRRTKKDKGMCMLVSQMPYFLHIIKLTNI